MSCVSFLGASPTWVIHNFSNCSSHGTFWGPLQVTCHLGEIRGDTLCLLGDSGCPLDRGAEPTGAGSSAAPALLPPSIMPVSLQVPTSHCGLGWACPRAPRRVRALRSGCAGWAGREEGLQGWGCATLSPPPRVSGTEALPTVAGGHTSQVPSTPQASGFIPRPSLGLPQARRLLLRNFLRFVFGCGVAAPGPWFMVWGATCL